MSSIVSMASSKHASEVKLGLRGFGLSAWQKKIAQADGAVT
jgi:hypothetical protein